MLLIAIFGGMLCITEHFGIPLLWKNKSGATQLF